MEKLLSGGEYKRAFLVRYDRFDGTQAELAPVESPTDVRRAAKSKYVPVSVGRVIEAIKRGEFARSIVVCTPCQLRAIRAALRHYGVSDGDVLFIGLFCQSMLDYRVYAHYEREYGGYDTLHFRDKEPNGWPGDTSLVSNGEVRKVDRKVRMELKKTHTPKCCTVCTDKLNEDADISMGDCYIPGFQTPDGVGGVSSAIVRTEKGREAFEACRAKFSIEEMTYDMVREAQKTRPDVEHDPRVYHVAIDIVSLSNRGQWLMFEAILEQVRGWLPNAIVYVDQKAYRWFAPHFQMRGVLPLLDPGVIDLLLYAPGFKFSDSFVWMESQMREDRDYFASFNKPGRKIVFLPQAFGPFEKPESLKHLQDVLVNADLIFSRESTSFGYLESAMGRDARFDRAPDFTCLYHDGLTGNPLSLAKREYIVVVPNVQMVKKNDATGGMAYRAFMVSLLRRLLGENRPVVLLNHSGANDTELIAELNESVGGRCLIAENLDAGECKRVLAEARLVVSSRYHALVSALTEGAPALCTSWSHKYQELLDELGCPTHVLDVREEKKSLSVVEAALQDSTTCLADPFRVESMRIAVYRMWRKIFSVVPRWAHQSRPIDGRVLAKLNDGWSLSRAVAKRDGWLKEKTERLAEAREAVAKRDGWLKEKTERLAEAREAVAKRDGWLVQKKTEVVGLSGALQKQDLELRKSLERIAGLESDIGLRERENRQLEADLGQAKMVQARQQAQIAELSDRPSTVGGCIRYIFKLIWDGIEKK